MKSASRAGITELQQMLSVGPEDRRPSQGVTGFTEAGSSDCLGNT